MPATNIAGLTALFKAVVFRFLIYKAQISVCMCVCVCVYVHVLRRNRAENQQTKYTGPGFWTQEVH